MSPLRDRPLIFYNKPASVTHISECIPLLYRNYTEWQFTVMSDFLFLSWLLVTLSSLRRNSSCPYSDPHPGSISPSHRGHHPGTSQPVQSRETKKPTAQSQWPYSRYFYGQLHYSILLGKHTKIIWCKHYVMALLELLCSVFIFFFSTKMNFTFEGETWSFYTYTDSHSSKKIHLASHVWPIAAW